MNGNNGYDGDDVLYIAFPGADAVPGPDGAKWDAAGFDEFEESIRALGDKLTARIGGVYRAIEHDQDGTVSSATTTGGTPAATTGPVRSGAVPGLRLGRTRNSWGRRAVEKRRRFH